MCPQHCHLSPSHSSHPLSAFFSPPSSENLQPRTAIPNRCPDETRRQSPPRRSRACPAAGEKTPDIEIFNRRTINYARDELLIGCFSGEDYEVCAQECVRYERREQTWKCTNTQIPRSSGTNWVKNNHKAKTCAVIALLWLAAWSCFIQHTAFHASINKCMSIQLIKNHTRLHKLVS